MKKSKIRLILTLMMVVCVIITSLAVPAFATENPEIIDTLPNFDENYIPSSQINYTIDDKTFCKLRDDVVEIIVSDETVEIEATLYSEYIDVFGKLENGKYIDITDEVKCEFEDESMAMWVFGRIIGDKAGTTTAVLNYNGLSKEITVTVNKQTVLNFSTRISNVATEENADVNAVIDPNLSARLEILDIAEEMLYMEWTPTQTFAAYNGHPDFEAGVTYTGMPYTQYRIQSTHDEFMVALESASDFYDTYTSGSITMSKYGNDCSGFVSICWGTFRDDTSWRNRLNTSDFFDRIEDEVYTEVEYSDLLPGDALLKRGHIMLVRQVSPSAGTITVYEQTGSSARVSVYTFAYLSTEGYIGVTKF